MKKSIIFISIVLLATSCGLLKQLGQQTSEVVNVKNCKFNVKSVESINVAGINLKNLSSLSAGNIATLSACLLTKQLPVVMGIKVGASNPTEKDASVTHMDWLCCIDDVQMAGGSVSERYVIPAQGSVDIPLDVNMNVYDIFSAKGLDAIKSFIGSFNKDTGRSSRLSFKVRPTVEIGSASVSFPNYISLN